MSLLRDERGSLSSARTGMWTTLVFWFGIIWADVFGGVEVENAIHAALSGILMGFMGWAAGPRIAQHLLPQVGALAQGVGNSIKARLPDRFTDDERG